MGGSLSRGLGDFLGEAEDIAENLNNDLITLGDCAETGVCEPDLLNRIFRGAHSLKGLSGMFGFDDVARLAHHLESLLDCLRLGKIALNNSLVSLLVDGMEILSRLINGKAENADFTFDLTPILTRIDQALDTGGGDNLPGPGFDGIDPEILNYLTEYEEHRLRENLKQKKNLFKIKIDFDLGSFYQEMGALTELLKQHGEVISTLPSAGELTDRIAFQIIFGSWSSQAEVARLLARDEFRVEPLAGGARDLTASGAGSRALSAPAPEPLPQLRELVGSAADGSLRSVSRTVRVDIDKLDLLMNVVGELVLAKASISAVGDRLRREGQRELGAELQKATRTLERRLEELQKGVMEVRMVPVAQLFDKMHRIVRKVASERGKRIALEIRGAETELDKLIIEDLSDPLMHIIRNAIDHGIESPEERRAAGKPETGTIRLAASQKGNHVVVEVRDDGKGIDAEKARRKAIEKGLVSPNAKLSRTQIYDLLFMPGFSTADEISDLSGRGVGMDVVRNNIAQLSGMIELDSEAGGGMALSITLPMTLAIIKALIVRVGGKTYAIPISSVLETVMVEAAGVRTIERREVIELRDKTLPLLWLCDLFHLDESCRGKPRFFVAVVGFADRKVGIVVDELLGQQDVVIKSLGAALSFVRGIAGAADLGNQKTILVLDVAGLMQEAFRGEPAFTGSRP